MSDIRFDPPHTGLWIHASGKRRIVYRANYSGVNYTDVETLQARYAPFDMWKQWEHSARLQDPNVLSVGDLNAKTTEMDSLSNQRSEVGDRQGVLVSDR